MVELSKAQLAGVVSLAMILAGTVTYLIPEESSVFYCEDRDMVLQCDRLSSTGKTCYLPDESGKRCLSIWKPITNFLEQEIKVNPIIVKDTPVCDSETKHKVVCKI